MPPLVQTSFVAVDARDREGLPLLPLPIFQPKVVGSHRQRQRDIMTGQALPPLVGVLETPSGVIPHISRTIPFCEGRPFIVGRSFFEEESLVISKEHLSVKVYDAGAAFMVFVENHSPNVRRIQVKNIQLEEGNVDKFLDANMSCQITSGVTLILSDGHAGARSLSFTLFAKTSVRSRFSLGTMLGRGTYGQVMRAQRRSSGQAYAIKIILPDQDLRVTGRKSEVFPREVQIMRKIKHKHVVHVHEIYDEGDYYYIAMELAEHGTLSNYLQGHHIDEGTCAGLSWQIVDALRYLHGSTVRIIHRDVKPENVLITSMNPTILKLTDFGLSKTITAKRYQTREVGTTEYMAPEVLLCHDSNELVDEWSLGVMIYYM
ncbi:kinase-like protein [Panus rudis PR-1116 ss-1]|nr:kinase-like protein [Panus rudis PR-1116 ss-1]